MPHDRLFLDALERDLKREKMGLEPTTVVVGEPAASFTYDPKRSLYDQFSKAQGGVEGEGELEAAVRRADEAMSDDGEESSSSVKDSSEDDASYASDHAGAAPRRSALNGPNSAFFSMFSLFEGSPTYKQRRKKVPKARRSPSADLPYGSGSSSMGGGSVGMVEPQIDRYGRDTTRMSAAEMFLAQARGEFGAASNPDLVASQKERQRRAMQASYVGGGSVGLSGPGVSAAVGAGAYPEMTPSTSAGMMPELEQYHHHHHQQQQQMRQHTYPMMAYAEPHRTNTQQWATTTKAFVCPLFSCGRMFKRSEHLKRHLRTHTLERPYACPHAHCERRFARADNLHQHLRTHDHDALHPHAQSLSPEPEAEMQDVQMCEVEVQGEVCDVSGDEEGLVLPQGPVSTPGSTIPTSSSAPTTATTTTTYFPSDPPSSSSPNVQWASLPSLPSSDSAAGAYVIHSAPAHKAAFDPAALYMPSTQQTNNTGGSGVGAIRRHRSATPAGSGRAYTYHPYASHESSPMQYSVPLVAAAAAAEYYRTDSPMGYPAAYVEEQQQGYGQGQGYAGQGQGQGEEVGAFYAHAHSVAM